MQQFGRYELIQPLDKGGMGEVWLARARGPERVHKTVVCKRIRADRATEGDARTRFAEEARVAMSLSHPHIVPVFEFGELAGEYFLVMEWLRGGNLARVAGIDRAPLSWTAVSLVGSQLCDALAYVHGRANRAGARLVHGDVTPRNVLLSSDGHALLADFGLARFTGHGRAGTVRYRAPEQARGDSFDARADLYALALVLSEAATGRPAYDLDVERAAKQALIGVIPDLDGCDAALAAVLRHALAASPDGRFADAGAMRAAFDALLDREPGARATGRAALIARIAAAPSVAPADLTRTAATQATREATVLAAPRRWMMLVLGALSIAALSAWAGRTGRRPVASASASWSAASPAPSQTSAASESLTAVSRPLAPPTPAASRWSSPSGASFLATPGSADAPPQGTPTATQSSEATGARRAASPFAPPPSATAAHRLRAPHDAPLASLDVNATPWAHVRVDGTPRGETPLLGLRLAPGPHRIELTNEPLGVHRELDLTLRSGEHATRIEDLTR